MACFWFRSRSLPYKVFRYVYRKLIYFVFVSDGTEFRDLLKGRIDIIDYINQSAEWVFSIIYLFVDYFIYLLYLIIYLFEAA